MTHFKVDIVDATKSTEITKGLTSVTATPSSIPTVIGSSQSKIPVVDRSTTKQPESKSQPGITKGNNDNLVPPAVMGSGRHSTTSLSSVSTEEDTPQLKWGPNLKRTRKIRPMDWTLVLPAVQWATLDDDEAE